MDPSLDEVRQVIRDRVKQALGIELKSDDQHFFLEAGVDSLAFLNVVSALEKTYLVKFANDTLPDLATCSLLASGLVDLLAKKKAAG